MMWVRLLLFVYTRRRPADGQRHVTSIRSLTAGLTKLTFLFTLPFRFSLGV